MTDSSSRSTPAAEPDPARLSRILEVVSDVFAIVSAECRIEWISAGVREIFGREPDEMVNMLAYDLFAKQENRDLHRQYFEGVLAQPGRHGPVEVTLARPDGRFLELELMLANELDDPALGGVVVSVLGVRIAIDDFGTGHASLDYIRRFAVADILKIDRTFVDGLEDESTHDRAIVAAVVALGGSIGFSVVAEGVETVGQRDLLVELGCELAQGFWFSEPLRVEELAAINAVGTLPIF
ncbi:MAG: EAL domain-containing protein [Acidimicrobiales bacterium]|nr:EAL domain-containing protein [Acidimicrobiales bacterium]